MLYFPGSCSTPLSNITNIMERTQQTKEARAKRKSILADAKVAKKAGILNSIRTLTFQDDNSPTVQRKYLL